jgi:signal transduction histidine kinase/DNA-binding response OmpR family regulator
MNKDIDEVKKGKIKQAIPLLKKLDLNYDDNIITLNFASLSYCIPEKNEYTYYLEGFDKNWVKAGNRQSATYTNLSPGTYVFHVKGANNDGVWNNQEATLTIVVHPPFYSTWWAKLLYILMLGGISWAAWNIYKKRMEEEQQIRIDRVKQEKEKELYTSKITFFTMIAHEIRTPVSLIIGPLEKILNKALDDSLRSDLQTVQRNGNRLLFLVNQLLDFRKVQQNMFKMHFTHNDIIPLIHATATRFKPWVEQRGATITINAAEKEIMVDFDYEAVTKILSNLLTNAAKYTTDKVIVSCKSDAEGKRVIISVEDNGTGIAEEEKQKIFRPFYQCESNKPGTGIGLTIVRNMVELHQGTVSVTSTPGKGSTFTVSLPLHQDKVDTTPGETTDINTLPTDIIPTQDTISQPKDDKPMLLIVDDNEEMLTFLSQTFVNDYTIMTALNGQQALKLVEDNNFQLIISDWMMPVMDGAQLCKKIRSNSMTSHIPFILLTAKTDLDSKIESMDIGADVFVEKPFSVHYLKSCIHNLISQRNMLIQKFSTMPLVPIKTIASHSEDERLLNKINEIIEENFSNPDLDVDFLASRMNLSRSSLYLKIKNVTDRTPNELIQLLRLKKAALLLAENKYRMNEICYMIGFSSPGYFSKCFFKQFGVRPSEYVNANNANRHE